MKDIKYMIYLMKWNGMEWNILVSASMLNWTNRVCYDECVLRLKKFLLLFKMLFECPHTIAHINNIPRYRITESEKEKKKPDKKKMVSSIDRNQCKRSCSLFSRFRFGRRNECTQFSLDIPFKQKVIEFVNRFCIVKFENWSFMNFWKAWRNWTWNS